MTSGAQSLLVIFGLRFSEMQFLISLRSCRCCGGTWTPVVDSKDLLVVCMVQAPYVTRWCTYHSGFT